ncbi:MAG: GTPase ObgE [Bacteroidales bacterium]|nr:GTPase ObgE [Bacteroidales bacterium]
MFVDRVELYCKAGDGGRGLASFRREKYVPCGGPDGGDGGHGGSIIVRAVANADNLSPLVHKKHWRAKSGEPGGGSLCTGSSAADLIIPVPPGTIVRDKDRGHLLKDLTTIGDEVVVAQGGRGGRGNRHFASATNRTPREFGPGEPGEERNVSLEHKVIADVGLIGFPNAGKSTLLSRLSRATPEIADYPFTTKHPNLGIVTLGGDASFIMADLPGLIEGASQGVGLGHEFLRHVERTRIVIHLVEPFPIDESDPVANYHTIRRELQQYSEALAAKPEILCVSKAELTGSETIRDRLAQELGRTVFLISSVTGQGLSQVVGTAAQQLTAIQQAEQAARQKTVPVEFGTEPAVRTTPEETT